MLLALSPNALHAGKRVWSLPRPPPPGWAPGSGTWPCQRGKATLVVGDQVSGSGVGSEIRSPGRVTFSICLVWVQNKHGAGRPGRFRELPAPGSRVPVDSGEAGDTGAVLSQAVTPLPAPAPRGLWASSKLRPYTELVGGGRLGPAETKGPAPAGQPWGKRSVPSQSVPYWGWPSVRLRLCPRPRASPRPP